MFEETQTLNDVCEFIVDCLHKTAPTQDKGYPSIRTPNVGRGRLILEGVNRVSQEVYDEWTRRAVPLPGDLILAREAPAGNVAIIKEGQTVCLGQRTVHLRPNKDKVDPDFLCYFLLAPKQQGALLAGETGATAGHVNMRDIRGLTIGKLPAKHSQKRAGEIIAAYDDLIENNRRRITLLDEAARQLYREWFVHFRFPGHEHVKIIDGLPEGWEQKPFGNIAELKYGKALKEENRVEGAFPVYGSSGIVGTHQTALVDGPAIIVGRKGNVGSIFLSPVNFWPIDTVFYIPKEQADFWLYLALPTAGFQNTDAGVPGLNRDFAYSRRLVKPSEFIRRVFNEAVEPMFGQRTILENYNRKLAEARDLLLPRLMNGEIAI
jgi:type I restriction enzyme S subunit